MPAPPDAHVDAKILASRGGELEYSFSLESLPRLVEAGAGPGTAATVHYRFREVPAGIAVDTALTGTAELVCQRCLRPMRQSISADSALLLVHPGDAGQDAGVEAEGREVVVADTSHLDLAWLAEEELLLALPLVPMHADNCMTSTAEVEPGVASPETSRSDRQKPFENLRDLLNKLGRH